MQIRRLRPNCIVPGCAGLAGTRACRRVQRVLQGNRSIHVTTLGGLVRSVSKRDQVVAVGQTLLRCRGNLLDELGQRRIFHPVSTLM